MIPKSCQRLAQVDVPIAVVSRHSAREKSIRHGDHEHAVSVVGAPPLAACLATAPAQRQPLSVPSFRGLSSSSGPNLSVISTEVERSRAAGAILFCPMVEAKEDGVGRV
jgi:hypothetical protein